MSDKRPIDPEGVYTISAAARLLSISPSTLRDLERRGKIECTWTPGRQRRFPGSELLRLLAAPRRATPRELCLRLQRGCGVRGWGRDGLGTGARGRGARALMALMLTIPCACGSSGAAGAPAGERRAGLGA